MGRFDDDDSDVAVKDEVDKSTDDDSAAEFDYSTARRSISKGWGKASQVKSSSSAFAERWYPTDKRQIIKFLDDEPYTSFRYHWLDNRDGQKSFTCIDDMHPQGCPLCSAGDKASSKFCFNIALWVDGDWVNKSYDGGTRLLDQLEAFHQDPATGPLDKHYWAVVKSGKKGSASITHAPVKERDLEEDHGVEAITEEQLTRLEKGKYDAAIVYIPDRKKLVEIATEELGD